MNAQISTEDKAIRLKDRFEVGDELTIVNTRYNTATVCTVDKVGRKYLYVVYPDMAGWQHGPHQINPDLNSYMILRGHRRDLGSKLRAMEEAHLQAVGDYGRARRDATWGFERQWDAAHPHPENPAVERYAALQKEAI